VEAEMVAQTLDRVVRQELRILAVAVAVVLPQVATEVQVALA
jgi:hypothetical protein